MESTPTTLPNPLKSEHLKEGIKPIIACVGNYKNMANDVWVLEDIDSELGNAHEVDYYEDPQSIEKRKFLGGGRETWVMSTIDGLNKFSNKFYDCTGLVVVGKDKITQKNISFLSHQDPTKFLYAKFKSRFTDQLRQRLIEIKDKCEIGTIDVVIVGGKYPINQLGGQMHDSSEVRGEYIKSIMLLSLEVEQVLGFEPVVINGPKTVGSFDNVYFDNKNRRLYLIRPDTNSRTGDFINSNIEEAKESWKR